MVAKVTERMAVFKQTTQKFVGKGFNFNQIIKLEVRIQNQIEISNRFAALEN